MPHEAGSARFPAGHSGTSLAKKEGTGAALVGAQRTQGEHMNILHAYRDKELHTHGGRTLTAWLRAHTTQIGESCWFCLTLALFLLMGPFSVIAVLMGLRSLASEENQAKMTEPARL